MLTQVRLTYYTLLHVHSTEGATACLLPKAGLTYPCITLGRPVQGLAEIQYIFQMQLRLDDVSFTKRCS